MLIALLVAFSSSLCLVAADFKLSDSKLLLPYYSFNAVNYTLHGSDGACYDWSSATPEVATVAPIYESDSECSKSAFVTAVWQSPHRAVTTIHARVSTTGHIVKCDVIVDNIHRIEIETITQELYLHNTPESLVAVGYDEFGNTFSTLDGVPFEWQIHGDSYSGAGDGHSVLRFLTWTESEYATPPGIAKLEERGLQGSMQLVSGLRTGSAVVGVSLSEPIYSGVKSSQVRLLVMANAQLSPALAYLLPGSRIRLRVRVIQQGSDQDVEEALENLRSVLNTAASSETDLKLPRRRLPTSLIHIVEPAYFGFSLVRLSSSDLDLCKQAFSISNNGTGAKLTSVDSGKSGRDWIMEVGKRYAFVIDLYDQNSHRIYPTDNIRVSLRFPENKMEVVESSENGTYHILRPIDHGPISLEARLHHVIDKNNGVMQVDTPVTGSQEIMIYPPVRIQPSEVILPWPGVTDNSKPLDSDDGFQLQATGGSGHITWVALPGQINLPVDSTTKNIQSRQVVTVTPSGQVSAKAFGEATVVAFSSAHPQLCGAVKVVVTSPSSIRFVPGPAEVVIPEDPHGAARGFTNELSYFEEDSNAITDASVLTVGIAVLDPLGRSMTDCRRLHIPVRPLDRSVLRVLPGRLPPLLKDTINGSSGQIAACVRLLVTGSQIGFTELEAMLDPSESQASNATDSEDEKSTGVLTSRFSVAVYQPIKFLDPISSKTYVATGSTRSMIFSRGPRPWPLEPTGYFSRIAPLVKGTKRVDADGTFPVVIQKPELWKPLNSDDSSEMMGAQPDPVSLLASETKLRPMAFTMQCGKVGVYEFVLQIGNGPSSLNPIPLMMSAKFTIVCDLAERLRLVLYRPNVLLPPGIPACPLLNTSTPEPSDVLAVPNTIPLTIGLAFFTAEGIELDAVDSLSTSISVMDPNSPQLSSPSALVIEPKPTVKIIRSSASRLLGQPSRPYFILKPHTLGSSSGLLTVRAEARSVFPASKSSVSLPTSSLNIRLSPVAKLLPGEHLRLLHHPKTDMSFSVLGGSGYFFVSTNPAKPPSTQSRLRLIPVENLRADSSVANGVPVHSYRIQTERVGQAEIRVVDRCFPSLKSNPTRMEPVVLTLNLEVVGLAALRLQAADQIPLGSQTPVILQAVDSRGEQLPLSLTRFLDVRVHQSSEFSGSEKTQPVLGLPDGDSLTSSHWISSSDFASGPSHMRFNVRGLKLGSATLIASTESFFQDSLKPSTVQSNPIDMQVFAPLSLMPCKFNLLVGAEYELRAVGGPQPALVDFTVNEESDGTKRVSVIRVTKNSVLIRAGATPGSTTIRARAVSVSSRTNVSGWDSDFLDTSIASEVRCTSIRCCFPASFRAHPNDS
ncbi:unnamed protein product [Echinostoma caproni]|uniref:Nuclear pore membrane glycoprotein n=1 Tax=Echinostoma caproni TaxID=27848 RepID=A0A183B1K9_9TREM|nr:unnamed protein product [Echinostoma caproni]